MIGVRGRHLDELDAIDAEPDGPGVTLLPKVAVCGGADERTGCEKPFKRDAVMQDQVAFDEFIRRIRAGNDQAAAEFVRQYEPLIRREVRLHLDDERLRRAFDSLDVCQSVLGSFFARTALGEYDLETPEHLVKLLVVMTCNKVAGAARRERRQRRDHRRIAGPEELEAVADPGLSPSEQVSGQELLERFRASFTDEERAIAGFRRDGLGWAEIADRMGSTAQARRMQFARAMQRVSRQLGLEEAIYG